MENIPIYLFSITPEQNCQLHELLQNSSEKELVDFIYIILNDLYPPEPRTNIYSALDRLIKTIHLWTCANEKYIKMQQLKHTWTKYQHDLELYNDALRIRIRYAKEREQPKAEGKQKKYGIMDWCEKIHKEMGINVETVRRCLFKESAKFGIAKPQKPKSYASYEEIPSKQYSDHEYLEKLGKQTLKFLVCLLLSIVDDDSVKNIESIPLNIDMRNCIFRQTKHKSKSKLKIFHTTLLCPQKTKEKFEDFRKDCENICSACEPLLKKQNELYLKYQKIESEYK